MVPRSASATTDMAPGWPLAVSRVPSMGSTATSTSGSMPLPTSSPKKSIGASSFSPSPMMTVPRMSTEASAVRMASTARWSASSLLPRPWRGAAASAAASVTRSSSRARLRSMGPNPISVLYTRSLSHAAAFDRQFLGLDHQKPLVGQAPHAIRGLVHAGALEDRGDHHRDPVDGGLEPLLQDLVLPKPDVAETLRHPSLLPTRRASPSPPAGGRQLRRGLTRAPLQQLMASSSRRAGSGLEDTGRRRRGRMHSGHPRPEAEPDPPAVSLQLGVTGQVGEQGLPIRRQGAVQDQLLQPGLDPTHLRAGPKPARAHDVAPVDRDPHPARLLGQHRPEAGLQLVYLLRVRVGRGGDVRPGQVEQPP